MIGVIDYKAGNAPSVLNALRHLEIPAEYVSTREQLSKAKALVLPGVGSAAATMRSLDDLNLLGELERLVMREGLPFLGICVGLQIIFDYSEEGGVDCLGWIPGRVRRFPEEKVRVPQMGWNRVEFTGGTREPAHFYFVNSYYAEPEDTAVIAATAGYGVNFCAMVRHENISATQFHLEKSGEAGLKLLKELIQNKGDVGVELF
ncbi:MAG: imidazole glycerol phosphate synthase subunit HisH [Clostridiales bacterium]|jgi:glutamine amidotransferase|nr:imidazole glycerol phosphate synthase subunit HisH [Clostridiales bacterium]